MIVAAPDDVHEFRPVPAGPVAYRFRTPSRMDALKYRREVIAAGGRDANPLQALDALADAARRQLADVPEELDATLDAIAAARDGLDAFYARVRAGDVAGDALLDEARAAQEGVAALNDLAELLRLADADYRAFRADGEVHLAIAGLVLLNLFCLGWEGLDGPFARRAGKVTEEAARFVPDWHLTAIGAWAPAMFQPTRAEEGNSASPSGTGTGGETSKTSAPATNGRSRSSGSQETGTRASSSTMTH